MIKSLLYHFFYSSLPVSILTTLCLSPSVNPLNAFFLIVSYCMPINLVESLYCIDLCHCVCPSPLTKSGLPCILHWLLLHLFRPGLVTSAPSLFLSTTSSLSSHVFVFPVSVFLSSIILLNDLREHWLILICSIAMAGAKRKLDTAHAPTASEGASQSANSNIPFPFFFLFH